MLRKSLDELIEPEKPSEILNDVDSSNVKMTPGQMLLAGFSGLFAKVEAELSAFYEAFKKLQHNDVFHSIDSNQEHHFKVTLVSACVRR